MNVNERLLMAESRRSSAYTPSSSVLVKVLHRPIEITAESNGMDSPSPNRHLGARLRA